MGVKEVDRRGVLRLMIMEDGLLWTVNGDLTTMDELPRTAQEVDLVEVILLQDRSKDIQNLVEDRQDQTPDTERLDRMATESLGSMMGMDQRHPLESMVVLREA